MSAQPFPSSSFFGTAPPPGFDPAALLQGLAQSDLPSFVHDILANLATAAAAATVASASSQEAGQGDAAIPPACPSSSSSSAAASKAAPLASTETSSSSSARRPRLDLSTTAASPTMTAVLDLPGLAKSDVSIALQPGKLVVSAQRRSASSTAKGKRRESDGGNVIEWHVRERPAEDVKWERELPLAVGVKPSEIKASMADGILTITYPKAATVSDEQQVVIE